MIGRVAGKVAIVTGAGAAGAGWGNGRAAAVLYAREGAQVVCCDRDPEPLAETVKIIEGEGNQAIGVACDVTDAADVEALVARAVDTYRQLDILHNNVGILIMGGPEGLALDDWRRMLDVNVTSMFLTCKYALPAMLTSGGGSIVNISSVAALKYTGWPAVAYGTSKGAVNAFTIQVAMEYADRGIRCNAILPGLMDTPMIREPLADAYGPGGIQTMLARRHAQSPTGRMGTAWDVAEAALFLASDAAAYINGATLVVDGGIQHKIG
jgi:NAD(P)-dependent dehydrogenase (short-subunit alcohol dehydrogenase family)